MKFTKNILLGVLVMVGLAAAPVVTRGQSFVSEDFLVGTNLLIPAATTCTFGTTNTFNYALTNLNSAVGTATTNANWAKDVDLWANRDGTALIGNISVHALGLLSNSTNVLTFTFYSVPRGGGIGNLSPSKQASTFAQNSWAFAMTMTGTNELVLATNIPTTFLQGAGRLRLQTAVATSTGSTAGTNSIVKSITLNGWKP